MAAEGPTGRADCDRKEPIARRVRSCEIAPGRRLPEDRGEAAVDGVRGSWATAKYNKPRRWQGRGLGER